MKNILRSIAGLALLALSLNPALAGSSPGWTYKYVPTAAEWNAAFAGKQDELGFTPLNSAGGTMFGRLITAASSATTGGLNVTPGGVPTSPVDGDMWMTTSGLFIQVGGSTLGPLTGATGANFAATTPLTVSTVGPLVTYACPTCGIIGSPLSQFASTTSAQLAGVLSDETGTGVVVYSTNPVLVTPNLGTPSAAVLTNATGLPIAGIAGLATGIGTFLATPSSANLAAAVTNETGTGNLVFSTTPTLVTPILGVATATSINGVGISGSGFNLAIAGNLTTAGALTQVGAFATTLTSTAITNSTLPAGTHTLAGLDVAQTWSANQSHNDGTLLLNGSTSGNLVLRAAATSASSSIRFPSGTTDFSATGGTSQVVQQASAGAPLTVGQLAASNLSNGVSGSGAVVLASTPSIASPTFTTAITATGLVKYADLATAALATTAQYQSGAANVVVPASVIFQAETTTTFSATPTLDFSTFINTAITLTGNITTMNVSNVKANQAGTITLVQDATGSRLVAFNSIFKFASGAAPVLSTTANAVDVLSYYCRSATFCAATLLRDVR